MDEHTQLIVREVARQAARETALSAVPQAINQCLTTLGIDPLEPIEAQKDFATLRELRKMAADPDFQRDMEHLRRWRMMMDGIQNKGFLAAFGFVTLGGLSLIMYAIKIQFFK